MTEAVWYWRIGVGVDEHTWESAAELERQCRLAEKQAWTQHTHGVSATTRDTPASARALRAAVDAQFRVIDTPTVMNPDHKTIELPRPVTDEVAELFNHLFGRKRP